jgi:hypothetical protein
MKIRHGGELEIGDFIAVGDGIHLSFGWYRGTGRNTVQFYHYKTPGIVYGDWEDAVADPQRHNGNYYRKLRERGFSSKALGVCYVYGEGISDKGSRVIKLENPESIFTEQDDLEAYRKSKEALLTIKFPVK